MNNKAATERASERWNMPASQVDAEDATDSAQKCETVSISSRVPESMRIAARVAAIKQNITLQEFVARAIDYKIKAEG